MIMQEIQDVTNPAIYKPLVQPFALALLAKKKPKKAVTTEAPEKINILFCTSHKT